jgi:ring-1,2-phenylacetyl-CoA epoxidase subunit PaaD
VVSEVAASAPIERETILAWLGEVMDPEVPVVSVIDLGIVRDVEWVAGEELGAEQAVLRVTVTPTYSGCPATEVIAQSIRSTLQAHGIAQVEVRTQLSPAWTTDWMSEKGREALRAYGIAPPVLRAPDGDTTQATQSTYGTQTIDISALMRPRAVVVPCPQCASTKTRLLSQFGSTACKALYQCNDCLEPFD